MTAYTRVCQTAAREAGILRRKKIQNTPFPQEKKRGLQLAAQPPPRA
jgi:hypothetical protein